MIVPTAMKMACDKLIKRVRFESACLSLPSTPFPGDDTKAIREATKVYVETYIVPSLEALKSGNISRLHHLP